MYWQEDRHQIFERAKHYVRTNLPPTGSDGSFTLKLTRRWDKSSITLTSTNHVTCYGIADGAGHVSYSEERQMFRDEDVDVAGEFYLKQPISVSTKSNGFEMVLMRPK